MVDRGYKRMDRYLQEKISRKRNGKASQKSNQEGKESGEKSDNSREVEKRKTTSWSWAYAIKELIKGLSFSKNKDGRYWITFRRKW